MAKRKIQSTIHVADGASGMVPLTDLRFDVAQWPIHFDVPTNLADHWIAHLNAESSERGWRASALTELEAHENSGTIVVSAGVGGQSPALEIVWDRPRGGLITVRTRPAGTPPMDLETANAFLDAVRGRCQAGTKIRLHRRAHLAYEGPPWLGELWLGNDLRLGPASKHAPRLIAPQIIIVDAEVDGIGWQGVNSECELLLRELSIFLSVVVGIRVAVEESGWAWTYESAGGKVTNCDLRHLGYRELGLDSGMPVAGQARPVPLVAVQRPGLEPSGIRAEDVEQAVPRDTPDLWQKFQALSPQRREQFTRAGNAYQIARSMWPHQRTAYLAFLVVACESLKPAGKRYDKCNIYDVVERLLGSREAKQLRDLQLAPQRVRSRHLHRGELAAGELASVLLQDHFGDPSFDKAATALTRTTRICLIEWLRQKGTYTLKGRASPAQKRTKRWPSSSSSTTGSRARSSRKARSAAPTSTPSRSS